MTPRSASRLSPPLVGDRPVLCLVVRIAVLVAPASLLPHIVLDLHHVSDILACAVLGTATAMVPAAAIADRLVAVTASVGGGGHRGFGNNSLSRRTRP